MRISLKKYVILVRKQKVGGITHENCCRCNGGDNAPQAIVEGVMLAKQDFPDIEFQLYGKEAEIKIHHR